MKRLFIICVMLLFVLTGCSAKYEIKEFKGKTIEELFSTAKRFRDAEIIYKENIDKGSLVFYIPGFQTNSLQGTKLGVEYVWRTSQGWAASYFGGMFSSPISNKIIFEYFPALEGSPFPIYFGEIFDSSIKRIVILDEKNGKEVEGTIISVGKVPSLNREVRLWYSLTDVSPSLFIKVKGLDDANKDVVILDTVYPSASTTISLRAAKVY